MVKQIYIRLYSGDGDTVAGRRIPAHPYTLDQYQLESLTLLRFDQFCTSVHSFVNAVVEAMHVEGCSQIDDDFDDVMRWYRRSERMKGDVEIFHAALHYSNV